MSMPSPDSTEWLEDIDAFISGEMNAQDSARFQERLRHDERARLVYVEYLDLHFELLQHAGHVATHDPATARPPRSRLALWLTAAAVAASLLVTAALFLFQRNGEQKIVVVPEPVVKPAPTPVEPAPVEPPVVARVGRTFNVQWTDSMLALQLGSLLRSGDVLDLYGGVVEIIFDSGATCCLASTEGVTAFLRVDSALGCAIESGQATFYVPQEAKGFSVITDGGRFVDLGTEFGVAADPRGPSQVHVLDGRVEAYGANESPLVLDRGAAARLSGDGSAPVAIPFNANAFAVPAAMARGIDSLSGALRLHVVVPANLRPGTDITSEVAHLFMERPRVLLESGWSNSTVNVRQVAAVGRQNVPAFDCPAGTRIDSYLVHATPTRGTGRRELVGQITFRRPIVALITTEDDLQTSRQLFGESTSDYPLDVGYGLERTVGVRADDKVDELVLSEDRRTLSFLLNVGTGFDQFRVLVASEDRAADPKVAQGKSP